MFLHVQNKLLDAVWLAYYCLPIDLKPKNPHLRELAEWCLALLCVTSFVVTALCVVELVQALFFRLGAP